MKKKNIEDLFKDSFENFEAEVSPSVWKNVQAALKGAGLGLLGKMLINKMGANAIVGIVSSAAAVVATLGSSFASSVTSASASSSLFAIFSD